MCKNVFVHKQRPQGVTVADWVTKFDHFLPLFCRFSSMERKEWA